jgi:hypothetical protein
MLIDNIKHAPKFSALLLEIPELFKQLCFDDVNMENASSILRGYGVESEIFISKSKIDLRQASKMFYISIAIEEIKYSKFAAKLFEKLTSHQAKGGEDNLFRQIFKIVEPFADKTLRTIPPSAIAQLFDLLGKNAILALAKEFGVNMTDIQISADGLNHRKRL